MTDTNAQGFIRVNGNFYHVYNTVAGASFTDLTEAELMIRTVGGSYESLWKSLAGQNLQEIALTLAAGSILTTCKIYDSKQGCVASWRGNERTANDMTYNLRAKGLNIPISKGMTIKLNTAD